jgi:hypothetical protein
MKTILLKVIFYCFVLTLVMIFTTKLFAQTKTDSTQTKNLTINLTNSLLNKDTTKIVKWYLYAGMGGVAYSGDLESYGRWSGMFHVGVQTYHNKRVNPRFEAFYGLVSGQNSTYNFKNESPNKFFQTHLFGVSANAQINIIKTNIFNFYISQGLGLAGFLVYDKNADDLTNQSQTRALGEVLPTTTLFLPTSIGGNAFFQNRFGLGLELSLLNTMTDYIDNIAKLGTKDGNDNLMRIKFSFFAPIIWKKVVKIK